jgi:hypothetical protein
MASAEPEGATALVAEDLLDAWPALDAEERLEGFRLLDPGEAESLFEGLEARDQCALLLALRAAERQLWMRQLAPDDAADAVQAADAEQRDTLLSALDGPTLVCHRRRAWNCSLHRSLVDSTSVIRLPSPRKSAFERISKSCITRFKTGLPSRMRGLTASSPLERSASSRR